MTFEEIQARQDRLLARLDYWEEEYVVRLEIRDGNPSTSNKRRLAKARRRLVGIKVSLDELENETASD